MYLKGLHVVDRSTKPRSTGLTWCIDDGMPLGALQDVISSFHRLIDGVKFGWGTALVTDVIYEKARLLQEHGIDYSFGGTLFEAYWSQDRLGDFCDLVAELQCPVIEISDGTVHLPEDDRYRLIREFKGYARVFSEVGSKSPEESAQWTAQDWVWKIQCDLQAGSELVILEARESGTAGLCLPSGEIRSDLSEGILGSAVNPARLMFEAPNKAHQSFWIRKLGPQVNLSNVPMSGAVNLETLRLGLRSDTFSLLMPTALVLR